MPSKEITNHQVLAELEDRITCTNRSLLPPKKKKKKKKNKKKTISD